MKQLIKKMFFSNHFKTSKKYWKNRYKKGGNSGSGSYNNLAEFKGEIINQFVSENNIKTIIELGCGDGNQLTYFIFPHYKGYDISNKAISICKKKFEKDKTKSFFRMKHLKQNKADLTLSLDVIYHLVEDTVFIRYMHHLFNASSQYVIIYSCDFDDDGRFEKHVRPRKFTDWVKNNIANFEMIKKIPNKYPANIKEDRETSFSDFYIYKKKSNLKK